MPRSARVNPAFRRWNLGRLPAVAPAPVKSAPPVVIDPDLPAIQPKFGDRYIRVVRFAFYSNRRADWGTQVIWETLSETEAIRVCNAQKYRSSCGSRSVKNYTNDPFKPMKDLGLLRHVLNDEGRVMCRAIAPHEDDVDRGDLSRILPDANPEWGPSVCKACLRKVEEENAR